MMTDQVTVLAGTTKGLFLIESDGGREDWTVRGPFCNLWPINHAIGDSETGRFWAAGGGAWDGAGIWRSEDGDSWELAKLSNGEMDAWAAKDPETFAKMGFAASPPAPFTGEVDAIWSLNLAHGTLYAGAKPASLFASRDGGANWDKMPGLTDHPSAKDWEGGGAGLTLHSIVAHPEDAKRMWVGISAAGVFATEDGGDTWDRRNRRANDDTLPDLDHPAGGSETEVGMCVHNMVRAPGNGGDLLYQQNHHGVLRSLDGGRSWHDLTQGLPSTFGFPITVNPNDPDMIWVVPLNGDSIGRYPIDGSAAVWRSTDGGANWQAMRNGLPEKNCYFTVLRQAMATDRCDKAGVYFGTNSGSVFASRDEGSSWSEIARHLPTVLCVETVTRPS